VIVISSAASSKQPLELGRFVEIARERDLSIPENLASIADEFMALLANQNLVRDALAKELRNYDDPAYVGRSASIPIYSGEDGLIVRANIWRPEDATTKSSIDYRDYTTTHNHDFTFITGTFLGPGYETELFRFSGDPFNHVVGDRVSLEAVGRETLAPGIAMIYEKCHDVHYQVYPAALSISINCFKIVPKDRLMPLYTFDTEAGRISSVTEPQVDVQGNLFDIAARLGEPQFLQSLERIAISHPHPRCRAAAQRSLDDVRTV
jgi:hypothetical protein